MHGGLEANRALLDALVGGIAAGGAETAVCVPFPYLAQVAQRLAGTPIAWGAQNVSEHASGAYTGEVSAAMVADFGCRFVIVGHSERRQLFGESDGQVAAKFTAVQSKAMVPILCVGETLAERDSGRTEAIVARQLDAVIEKCGSEALGGPLAQDATRLPSRRRRCTPSFARALRRATRRWHRGCAFSTAAA